MPKINLKNRDWIRADQLAKEVADDIEKDPTLNLPAYAVTKVINDYLEKKLEYLSIGYVISEPDIGSSKVTMRRVNKKMTGVDESAKITTDIDTRLKHKILKEANADPEFKSLLSGGRM